MPARKHSDSRINLLPKDPFLESQIGKMLNWALSTGRYIVIFTELVVIVAFLSRFVIDSRLNGINDSILKKQTKIKSLEGLEKQVKDIQAKGGFLTTVVDITQPSEWLSYVLDNSPSDITYEQITIKTNNSISLKGSSFSQKSLSDLVDILRQEPRIVDVVLSTIESSEKSSGVTFSVQAKLQGSVPTPKPSKATKVTEDG